MADQEALFDAARTLLDNANTLTAATALGGGTYTWGEVLDDFEDMIAQFNGSKDADYYKRMTILYTAMEAELLL